MAEKYCDHGLYGGFTCDSAHWSTNNATLTIASGATITGRLGVGAFISGGGLAANTFISALGTGTGGVGTYTFSPSGQTIASPGATLVAVNGGPADVPEWGVAQDGDGTALGAATSATASIVFSGIPNTGTIQVLGVTLSPTWATSASVCADNLATAINAATGTATGPAALTVKSQVRNHVYARGPSNGAAADTCEIMTRQGSANFNGQVCIAHTLNNVSTSSPINFSGGAGGAWGLLFHTHSVWRSGLTAPTYGVWGSTTQPFCGVQAAGDVVHIRAKTLLSPGHMLFGPAGNYVLGTTTSPIVWDIDDGTVWTADAGTNPVLLMRCLSQSNTHGLSFAWSYHDLKGKKYADGTRNLVFESTYSGGSTVSYTPGQESITRNLRLEHTSGAAQISMAGLNTLIKQQIFENLYIKHKTTSPFFTFSASNNNNGMHCYDTVFDNTGAAAANLGIIQLGNSGSAINFYGLTCSGFVTGSRLLIGAQPPYGAMLNLVNADLGLVTVRGPTYSQLANFSSVHFMPLVTVSSQFNDRDMLFDCTRGFVEWNSAASFPLLSATLPNGHGCSWRLVPTTYSGNVTRWNPLVLPRIAITNSLSADAAVEFSVELLVNSAITWTKKDISLRFIYMDQDDEICYVDTYDPAGGALGTSTASWTATYGTDPLDSVSKPTWNDGGTLYYNRRKITVQTPTGHDLKAGTEVAVYINVHSHVANTTQGLFINPEIGVAEV